MFQNYVSYVQYELIWNLDRRTGDGVVCLLYSFRKFHKIIIGIRVSWSSDEIARTFRRLLTDTWH